MSCLHPQVRSLRTSFLKSSNPDDWSWDLICDSCGWSAQFSGPNALQEVEGAQHWHSGIARAEAMRARKLG